MKPAAFAYHRPATVAEAIELLSRLDNAKLLAGGQSLVPVMNFRLAAPDHLIDINGIAELAGIHVSPASVRIGAMTRQREAELSAQLHGAAPVIREALEHVGHLATRNRGTVGGSLCHLDMAAELPVVMLALEAVVEAASPRGLRGIPMREFARHMFTTALAPDEIATAVSFAPWKPGHGYAFCEAARRHGDFAMVSVCALLETDPKGRIGRAALVLGGMGAVAQRCTAGEALLVNETATADLYAAAAAEAEKLDAVTDLHVEAWYRRRLARVLTRRALAAAGARCAGALETGRAAR